jgi:hypothetical protein
MAAKRSIEIRREQAELENILACDVIRVTYTRYKARMRGKGAKVDSRSGDSAGISTKSEAG